MGCCAQSQSGQSQIAFNFTTFSKYPSSLHNQRSHLSPEDGEMCGEQFSRISNYHKALGNDYLLKGDFPKAITEFTKAIDYNPDNSVYFSNRALCFKAQREWHNDCRHALALDPNNLKALNIFAVSLIEMDKYNPQNLESIEEAVKSLEKAFRLLNKQEMRLEGPKPREITLVNKEIELKLRKARKMLVIKRRIIETPRKKNTECFVRDLLKKNSKAEEVKNQYLVMFEEIMKDQVKETCEVPDYLTCKISYEVMKDPKLTPDGLTYDCVMLEEHFQKMGFTDPITRKEIDMSKVVSNVNLRKAVDHFFNMNPDQFEPEKQDIAQIEL